MCEKKMVTVREEEPIEKLHMYMTQLSAASKLYV